MNTKHLQNAPEQAPRDSASWLGRAWTAVALMPVFFFVAFAVGEGLYALLGYQPENADAPAWVVLVALAPTFAVVQIPCVAAVLFGNRAKKGGDRRGTVIGVIVDVGWLVLTIVSEVGNIVRQ